MRRRFPIRVDVLRVLAETDSFATGPREYALPGSRLWMRSASAYIVFCSLVLSGLGTAAGCRPVARVADQMSAQVPFDELFVSAGTVQLDSSVIVSDIMFLDVAADGRLLVSDYSLGRIHVFSSDGSHLRTLRTDACAPGAQTRPMYARFLGNGGVVASTGNESLLFDSTGRCERIVRSLTPPPSAICARGDTLYGYTQQRATPIVRSYSSSMTLLDEYDLPEPNYPLLTQIYHGLYGLQVACFSNSVVYVYPESADARSIDRRTTLPQYRAPFYHPPTRDRRRPSEISARLEDGRELELESTLALAVLPLDDDYRLMVFGNSPRARVARNEISMGLNIIGMESDSDVAVSTYITRAPLAARNGFLYTRSPRSMDTIALGNPTIEVYEFQYPNRQES